MHNPPTLTSRTHVKLLLAATLGTPAFWPNKQDGGGGGGGINMFVNQQNMVREVMKS